MISQCSCFASVNSNLPGMVQATCSCRCMSDKIRHNDPLSDTRVIDRSMYMVLRK